MNCLTDSAATIRRLTCPATLKQELLSELLHFFLMKNEANHLLGSTTSESAADGLVTSGLSEARSEPSTPGSQALKAGRTGRLLTWTGASHHVQVVTPALAAVCLLLTCV